GRAGGCGWAGGAGGGGGGWGGGEGRGGGGGRGEEGGSGGADLHGIPTWYGAAGGHVGGAEVMGLPDEGEELVTIEAAPGPEQGGVRRVEGVLPGDEVRECVAHGDEVVHREFIPAVHEHLLHDLRRGSFTF